MAMAYTSTLILVAPDCPVDTAIVPVAKNNTTPIHLIQYELLTQDPYAYDHEALVFAVHVRRLGLTEEEIEARHAELWADLFVKGHPCMRASSLTKRYGWGAHYDAEGRIALFGMDSAEYDQLCHDDTTQKLFAMRSKRA
jgi:hypothetical protein